MSPGAIAGRRACRHEVLLLVMLLGIGSSVPGLTAEADIRAFLPPPDERLAYAQAPAQRLATAAALVAQARQAGSVRVIVGLNTSFTPSGRLSSVAAGLQRQGIGLAQQDLLDRLKGTATTQVRRFRHIPFIALRVNANALNILAALPLVLSIEESVADAPDMASSNPVIGSPFAWDAGYDGSGQVVASIDTGVDKTHPFFAVDSKVVAEACFSTTAGDDPEGGSSVSLCPGGVSSSTASGSGLNCPTSVVGCSHGTHVAGTAVGNDHVGPNFGVARGAKLIAVQVFSRFNSTDDCGPAAPCALSFPDDQLAGLEHIYDLRNTYPIAAVNMSLGGGNYSSEVVCDSKQAARKAAIDNLRSVGIATVISTGNNSKRDATSAPGCISTAVAVAATTDDDAVASFSNIAPFVELLAPGVDIVSSVPGGGTESYFGTSMSAPHVTGAWAVMKQRFPTDSVSTVLGKLQGSGKSVDDTRSGGSVTDLRRIRLDLALEISLDTVFEDGFELP